MDHKKWSCQQLFLGIFTTRKYNIFKNLYIKAGGINPKFKMAGDYDLWKRFAKFEN